LTFELEREFCTLYLTAKIDRPAFSRSKVIVRTNKHTDKQTDAAENIHLASLLYDGGNQSVTEHFQTELKMHRFEQ